MKKQTDVGKQSSGQAVVRAKSAAWALARSEKSGRVGRHNGAHLASLPDAAGRDSRASGILSALGEKSTEGPAWLPTTLVLVLAAIPRLTSLRAFIAHDETLYWEWARGFFFALLRGDWLGTIVGPGNPSVTLFWNHALNMGAKYGWAWITGAQVAALNTWPDFGPQATFNLLIERRLPIVIFNSLAVVIAYWLVRRLLGGRIALFAAVLLALDPFYLADSRTSRGEGLLASLAMLAILSYLACWALGRFRYLIFSGIATGLALLTKMSAISLVMWAIAVTPILAVTQQGSHWRNQLKSMLLTWIVWGLVAVVTFWALWPAMWVSPSKVFDFLLSFISDVGVSGRDNYFFGQVYHDEPLPLYYLVVYILRVTPLAWIGLLAAFGYIGHTRFWRHWLNLADSEGLRSLWTALILAFGLIYSALMTVGTLKRDWYLLPAFPALDIVAAVGLAWAFQLMWDRLEGRRWTNVLPQGTWSLSLVLVLMIQTAVSIPSHPYYYTYWNPLVLGSRWAAKAVMVGWDLDLSAGAHYLNSKPGAEELWAATHSTRGFEQIFRGHTVRWVPGQPWIQSDYLIVRKGHLQLHKLESSLLNYLSHLELDHVVTIGGVDYLWIYKGPKADHFGGPSTLTGKATLLGYDLEDPRMAGGGKLSLKLYWQNDGMAPDDDLFVRLVDAGAYVWDEAVAVPLPGFEKAVHADGQIVESEAMLMVPIGTPPGTYFLHSGVYSHSRREVLGYFTMPSDGDRIIVTRLTGVQSTARPSVEHELNLQMSSEISLLGFDLPDNIYVLSDDNWLTLYWQANADVGKDYVIGVQLVDSNGKEIAYWLGRPATSGYPTREWATGEIVRDPWLLKLPPAVFPGDYELRLTLFDGETGVAVNQLTLGDVSVAERPRSFDVPVMQNIVNAHLGDWITLLGYDLFTEPVNSGGRLQVVLYWQAQTEGTGAYSVFVHMIGPDGRVVAQHDGPPAAGAIPTNEWAKGEVVIDKHLVEFSQLPSGTYQIVVGAYDPSTMVRLPILAANGSSVDGLLLEKIEIQ